MKLLWLQLPITCSAIFIQLSKGIIEARLDNTLLEVIFWSSLQIEDNYPTMGQLMDSFGLGQTQILANTCSKWTRNVYTMVRKFVVANPRYGQYFLTPDCRLLLQFLTIDDVVQNWETGLYMAMPTEREMENKFALRLALLNIDRIDRDGLFRSRLVAKPLDWTFMLTDDLISAIPVSKYLNHHMIKNFSSELEFARFLHGNLDLTNVENYLAILGIAIERLVTLRNHEAKLDLKIQEARILYDLMLKHTPDSANEVLTRATRIIAFAKGTAPGRSFSGLFKKTDPIQMVKLGILVHGIEQAIPSSVLLTATRQHLKVASDFEFVEILRLITEYGRAGSCRLYTGTVYKRLHRIRPELIRVKPTVMGCFTAEERIDYFRRWECVLPRRRHLRVENVSFGLTWPKYLFRVPIFHNPLVRLKRLFDQSLEQLRGHVIVFSTNYGRIVQHWLSLNNPSEHVRIDVMKLFTLLLLSKLHYDGIGYELDYKLAYEVVCQPKDRFTQNLNSLSSGIMVAYNVIC